MIHLQAMFAAFVLPVTTLQALIAGLILLDTGLIGWLDNQNSIPFSLPLWARTSILIPVLTAAGTGLASWQNGGDFVAALIVALLGVMPGILLVCLAKLSDWFRKRKAAQAPPGGTSRAVPPGTP